MNSLFSALRERLDAVLEALPSGLRRPAVALPLGALFLVLVVGAFAIPSVVLSRAQASARARGMVLHADDVDVGLSGVSFEGVSLMRQGGKLPFLKASRVDADMPAWSWPKGARGVRALTVEGARLELDEAELTALRTAQRGARASEAEEQGPAASLPALHVLGASLTVKDAAGALVSAENAEAHLAEDGTLQTKVARVVVGSSPGEVIYLDALHAAGRMIERRPVISSAGAGTVLLEWAPELEAKPGEPWPGGRGRTLARLLALRGERKASAEQASTERRPRPFTEDARLALDNMRVVAREQDGSRRPILEELDVVISADGPDAMRARGAGKAPPSGAVAWDLRVVPGEARVEGTVSLDDVSLALFAPVLPRLPFFELDRTRVHADLALSGKGLETVAVNGKLSLVDLGFADEGLSRVPVGPFSMAVEGEGAWTPARRELSIAKGRVKVADTEVTLAGVLAWPHDGYRVDIDAQLAKTRCRDLLASLPAGLLDDLAAVVLDGDIAGKLHMHVDATDLDATKVDFDVADACRFVSVPPLLDLMRFEQPFIHTVLEPDGSLFELETGPGTPAWTPIELISPFMIQSVVAHEDGRFFGHHGFAEPEIAVALSRNLKARGFRFGASTITMQLVKNVFLHRDKLLARKVQEAFITWWLEQQWDKRRILQLYLNVIEYGPAIYGLRNAAWHYFGTIPMNLTPAQSAFLASVLPSPKTFHEQYDKGQLSSSMKGRLATFMKHLHARQRIDDEALSYGLEELEQFTFYDPDKPPPPPPLVRGSAQAPPFDAALVPYDQWDLELPVEDGSFGNP